MKTVTANPDLIELAQTWAQANPMEFFAIATVALGLVCYKLRDVL